MKLLLPLFLLLIFVGSCLKKNPKSKIQLVEFSYSDLDCYSEIKNPGEEGKGRELDGAPMCEHEKKAVQDYYNFRNLDFFANYSKLRSDIRKLRKYLIDKSNHAKEENSDTDEIQNLADRINSKIESYLSNFSVLSKSKVLAPSECDKVSKSDQKSILLGENVDCTNDPVSVSYIALLLAFDCIYDLPENADIKLSYNYCKAIKLSEKLDNMANFRVVEAGPNGEDEGLAHRMLQSVKSYRRMSLDVRREINRTISELSILKDEMESGNYDLTSPSTVPYLSIVAGPAFFLRGLTSAFNDWKNSFDKYTLSLEGQFEKNRTNEEIEKEIQNLGSQTSSIHTDKEISSHTTDKIDSEINEKVGTIKRTISENANSLHRIKSEFENIIGSNATNLTISNKKILTSAQPNNDILVLDAESSLTTKTYPLNSFGEGMYFPAIIQMSVSGDPKIVANGVLYNSIETLKYNIDYLDKQPHWKYSGDGQRPWKWGKGRKKKWEIGSPPSNVFDRDYKVEPNRSIMSQTKNLGRILNSVGTSHRKSLTNGFDGYIIGFGSSEGTGTGSSESTSKPPFLSSLLSTAGAATGAYLSAGNPYAAAAGGILGAKLGSSLEDSPTGKSKSQSFSNSINWRQGIYHQLAKYPRIRLGQLVAELGCDGNFPSYTRPKIDKFGRFVEFGYVTPPVEYVPIENEKEPENFNSLFRKPAGTTATIIFDKLPGNTTCNKPSIRFAINDYPEGSKITSNCTGKAATCDKNCAEEKLKIPDFDPELGACTYSDKSFSINIHQLISTEDAFNNGISALTEIGVLDPTNPGQKFIDLAYSADPMSEIEIAYTQAMTNASVSPDIIEKLKPLGRHFAVYLMNLRTIETITQQITRLNSTRNEVKLTETKLDNQLDFLSIMKENTEAIGDLNLLYKGYLKSREEIYQRAMRHYINRMQQWYHLLYKSLEYHQYSNPTGLADMRNTVQDAIANIEKLSLTKIEDLKDNIDRNVIYEELRHKLYIGIDNTQNTIAFADELTTLDAGHCFVSLSKLFPSAFGPSDGLSHLDVTDPKMTAYLENRKSLFKKSRKDTSSISGYSLPFDKDYYQIPIDTTRLAELAEGNKASCSGSLSAGKFIPKILGFGVEILGKDENIKKISGQDLYLTRSNVMGWTNIDFNDVGEKRLLRTNRIIDYSMLLGSSLTEGVEIESSLPASIKAHHSNHLRGNGPCSTQIVPGVEEPCAKKIMGSAELISGGGFLNELDANFRLNEFNTFLGNQWSLIIPEFTSQGIDIMSAANNIIVHFYYYKRRNMVTVNVSNP